ncbi:beta-ketoacyl-ACP synthase III [Mucilaginibacter sp. AW1-7]|jgi:3-oxoacyl-[acyl-carrier-protein] synthase-3|uniref:beta-ketoacyl-ACP synthase III n=1 Tax=unclassified Mucilaginibacter TaxID=2617802 RepID=UPI0008B16D3F|nr:MULTISPECIES: beta-ketoacyl-ACP synthase III [unclassified Mucilaginibacter]WDF79963.1 ketoacyl-ACP synthase III [Mucilaginibacter sp. KACC 22773]SEO95062.1 3-oxoacyl-[acyl-carrier-protein] synthase-3 [Mucilaginibacter sp. OK283]
MRLKSNAVITGVGGFVPDNILSNSDLEKMVDTNSDWIVSRTGIKERRILTDPTLATSDMAVAAVKNLLENTGVSAEEIDCLIIATSTPDHLLLSTASIVCDKVGLSNAWATDVNAACSGFLYAYTLGASLVESNRYKKVIVIGADQNSAIINYKDRNTCILFGDGAGAVLLEPTTEDIGLIDSVFKTDGHGREYLLVPGGGSKIPATVDSVEANQHYIRQEGRIVFKAAIKGMTETCTEVLKRNDMTIDDVNWLIPHQANYRIIHAVGENLGLPEDRVKVNIDRYGNTTAATIPLCLWDFQNDFKHNDNIIFTAFGAGFSWGATLLKWGTLRKA